LIKYIYIYLINFTNIKESFDNYINKMFTNTKYNFIKAKYNL